MIAAKGQTLSATERSTFSGTVATFTDLDTSASASDFTATIDWGDGTSSVGTVVADPNIGFDVKGSHAYSSSGFDPIVVSVQASGNGGTATVDSTASVSQAPASINGGATSGNSNSSSPTSGTSSNGSTSSPPAEPLTPTQMYVTAVYQDVLGRAPDASGLAYWSNLIDHGAAISSVAEQIAHSIEYYTNFVIQPDYQKLLHRAGTPTEVHGLVTEMQQGLTDQGVEARLVATDEFFANAGGNNTAWVDAVYRLMLGRQVDPSGEQWWTAQLADGQSRSQVANQIADSNDNDTQLINDDYFHYLGRAADQQGLAWWLGQFHAGSTNEDAIAGFTGSQEYYQKHTS